MTKSKKRRRKAAHNRKALPRTPSGAVSRSAGAQIIRRVAFEEETRASLAVIRSDRARGLGLTPDQADDPISETIAGRMALRGLLTRLQAEAIDTYGQLVRNALRAIQAPASTRCSLNLKLGGEGIEVLDEYRETLCRYNDAFGAIRTEAGYRACLAINLVVRDLCEPSPAWLAPARTGASALVRHFKLSDESHESQKRKAA